MRATLLLALGLLLPASDGVAQPAAARSDSTARARVLEHLWEILAPRLQAASLDTASQAWTLAFPDDELPWARIAAHLRSALRARDPLPSDTAVWRLTVGPVQVERDTAWATITVDYEHRCAPGARPGGWGNVHRVFAPRVGRDGPWGPARTRTVAHGARASCRVPARR